MSNYIEYEDVDPDGGYYFRPFDPDEDYFEELKESQGTRCQACHGSGLDKHEDVDCMNCWGEGVVYGNL